MGAPLGERRSRKPESNLLLSCSVCAIKFLHRDMVVGVKARLCNDRAGPNDLSLNPVSPAAISLF